MKSLAALLLFVLCGVYGVNGQTDKTACPAISVTGPAGVVAPSQTATFVVNVGDGSGSYPLGFRWTSSGKIVKGQGTPAVEILFDFEQNSRLVAEVEILGLSKQCPNTASEMTWYCAPNKAILLNEIKWPIEKKAETALTAFAAELLENSNDQGYIILYVPGHTSESEVVKRTRQLIDRLVQENKMPEDRITLTIAEDVSEPGIARLYRVPPGAENPQP